MSTIHLEVPEDGISVNLLVPTHQLGERMAEIAGETGGSVSIVRR